MNRKRVLAFMLISASALMSASAQEIGGTGEGLVMDLSFVQNAVNLIVGIFAGGYVLLKAALDIFHAVRNSSEDPNGLKKAIGGLMLNVAILGGFLFVIDYVFGAMGKVDGKSIKELSAQQAFFASLTGALVTFF